MLRAGACCAPARSCLPESRDRVSACRVPCWRSLAACGLLGATLLALGPARAVCAEDLPPPQVRRKPLPDAARWSLPPPPPAPPPGASVTGGPGVAAGRPRLVPAEAGGLPPPRVRTLRAGHPLAAAPGLAPAGALLDAAGAWAVLPSMLDGTSLPRLVAPPDRPQRPPDATAPRPEDLVFEVAQPGGLLKRDPQGDGSALYLMLGNPRLYGSAHRRADGRLVEALSIKGTTFAVWVDERALPGFSALGIPGADAPGAGRAGERASEPGKPLAELFEDAVLGIYAEGDVEVMYGTLALRAEAFYLEPRSGRGLLVDASFGGRVAGKGLPEQGIPLDVRARRGRLVAKGLLVFDGAEIGTSRSDDRIELRVQRLTVEQMQAGEADDLGAGRQGLLGFHGETTQRFRAERIAVRGERLPLGSLPYASFGTSAKDPLPLAIERVDVGNRSSLGAYGFVGFGGDVGPEEAPWLRWVADVGGYTKRGPAAGLELSWERARTRGRLLGWGVLFDQGEDRSGYAPDAPWLRGRVVGESRTQLGPGLLLDVESSVFSDRGFNREFFERDDLVHKDRESYARLLWRQPSVAATLTGRWHARDFVTETVELPQAGLWVGSVPLLVPGRAGGLGVDLSSSTTSGWLGRRVDEALPEAGYEAWRTTTDTRAWLSASVGDVRLSGHLGASAAMYEARSDGGEDLVRSALLAGLQASLQFHRCWARQGGLFELDGLRHVVDVDLSASGRLEDSAEPDEVPWFDEREEVREASQLAVRMRHRFQSRAPGGALRDLLDLESRFAWYPDDQGPWLQDMPWSLDWNARGQPRPGGRWELSSEGWVRGDHGLRRLTAAVAFLPAPRVDVTLGYRYLQGEAAAPVLQAGWRFSERYEARLVQSYNFREASNFSRLLFRRFSADHVWTFGVSLRDDDDVGFELDFRPSFGSPSTAEGGAFDSEVDLDPLGAMR